VRKDPHAAPATGAGGEVTETQIDVAPDHEFARYLGLMQKGLDKTRRLEAADEGGGARFCGYVADVLHNLPDLLLRFHAFDESQFWRSVRGCRRQVSPQLTERWDAIFEPTGRASWLTRLRRRSSEGA
jgi:hypothetical protein